MPFANRLDVDLQCPGNALLRAEGVNAQDNAGPFNKPAFRRGPRWDTWMRKTGGRDLCQRANVEAQRILSEHHPECVSKEQAQEIDHIANAAQQWFIENWQDDIH